MFHDIYLPYASRDREHGLDTSQQHLELVASRESAWSGKVYESMPASAPHARQRSMSRERPAVDVGPRNPYINPKRDSETSADSVSIALLGYAPSERNADFARVYHSRPIHRPVLEQVEMRPGDEDRFRVYASRPLSANNDQSSHYDLSERIHSYNNERERSRSPDWERRQGYANQPNQRGSVAVGSRMQIEGNEFRGRHAGAHVGEDGVRVYVSRLKGAVVDAPLVNSWISKSLSLPELMRHVRENRQSFDFICASAAVSKGAKLINKRSQSDVNDFLELVEIAREYLPQMENRNIGNFLYSLAKAGQYDQALIREIIRVAQPKLSGFNPQALTNSIWALATLNYSGAIPFIRQLLKGVESKLQELNPQNVTNIIWALATLKYTNGSVFIKEMLKEAEPKLRDFNPQNLSIMAWSLANLNYLDISFIKKLLQESAQKLREFHPQNLSNLVWALASLKYAEGSTFIKQLLIEAETKLSEFRSQNMSNLLWALATLNFSGGFAFTKLLMKEYVSQMNDHDHQNLANTAWALAVLDHNEAPLFLTSFLPLAYKLADSRMKDPEKYQCLQYLRLMEDEGHVTAEIKADPRYENLKRTCQDALMHERTSRKQSEILRAIRRLPGGSYATYEQLTEDGLFTIDIALQLSGGQKLAIEVDGPSHFLSDERTLNGSTVLRNRMLENRGWKVISIPLSAEWALLSGDADEEAYLLNKLKQYIH